MLTTVYWLLLSLHHSSFRIPHFSNLFVRRDRRRQIIEHTTDADAPVKLVERNVAFGAARHSMRTARREVTARGEVRRLRNRSLDGRESLLLFHLSLGQLWNRTQKAL